MGIFGDGGSRDDHLQLEARAASLETMVAQLAATVSALGIPGQEPVTGAPSARRIADTAKRCVPAVDRHARSDIRSPAAA